MADDSTFLRHIPCPACGSSDANAEYTDGHTHCFACGVTVQAPGDRPAHAGGSPKRSMAELVEPQEWFNKRGIHQRTAEKFKYGVGEYKGSKCHIAPYYNAEGQLVAQKLRFKKSDGSKSFAFIGDTQSALPFGAQLWQKTGKMIVVTEGEMDALSVSQVQDNKWPVVSISCGADKPFNDEGEPLPMSKIRKYFAQHSEYFRGFEKVVLMFDSDPQGRHSAVAAAEVLGMRAHIAELPEGFKDANEMLQAGKIKELVDALWRAKQHRPEGIVDLASLRKESQTRTGEGLAFPWAGMNRITHGLRTGELIGFGAGTGTGKTDVLTEIMLHLVQHHGVSVGAFFLESTPVELSQRFAGKMASKPFHLPGGDFTQADVDSAWDKIEALKAKAYLYDSFGVNEWDTIEAKIEFLFHAEGVRYFIVDHMTAFAANDPENERTVLEALFAKAGKLVKRLPICVMYVSHLATPEKGLPHEEGGRISMRHFKGARAIGQWTHIAFGLERNQQAEEKLERFTTTMRCVKNRPFGQLNGEVFYLRYDPDTGRQHEVKDPEKANDYDFTDETKPEGPEKGSSDF